LLASELEGWEGAKRSLFSRLGWSVEREPFSASELQSPKCVVNSNRECFEKLSTELSGDRFQLFLIVGRAGSGKSLLRRMICEAFTTNPTLSKKYRLAVIEDPAAYTELALLRAIGYSLGLTDEDYGSGWRSKARVLNKILKRVAEEAKMGRRVIIIIDEGQKLSAKMLDILKRISDLEYNGRKVCKTIILTLPTISRKLKPRCEERRVELEPLVRRTSLTFIRGFSEEETREYIAKQIAYTKGSEDFSTTKPFTEEAVKRIHQHTQGQPAKVRELCAATVDLMVKRGATEATPKLVDEAWEKHKRRCELR
jgi:type II secretory pathway predicted ATPase ExeA